MFIENFGDSFNKTNKPTTTKKWMYIALSNHHLPPICESKAKNNNNNKCQGERHNIRSLTPLTSCCIVLFLILFFGIHQELKKKTKFY